MHGTFDFYQDLPGRPKRPERLFFGLLLDSETTIRVARFREQFLSENHLEGSQIKPERLHLSLHHVGDYKSLRTKFIYAARQAGNAISMRPFEITFRSIRTLDGRPPTGGRLPKRPLVLLGEGNAVGELHKTLGAAMKKNRLTAGEFLLPHVTLLYGLKEIFLQSIEPIRFVVKEFVLIHSELGLTRYNVIDRWSLGD